MVRRYFLICFVLLETYAAAFQAIPMPLIIILPVVGNNQGCQQHHHKVFNINDQAVFIDYPGFIRYDNHRFN